MIFGKPVICPLCHMKFVLDEIYEKGDIVNCVNCRGKLKIISINPPVLDGIKSKTDGEKKGENNESKD